MSLQYTITVGVFGRLVLEDAGLKEKNLCVLEFFFGRAEIGVSHEYHEAPHTVRR
jgi:hypothetical protein